MSIVRFTKAVIQDLQSIIRSNNRVHYESMLKAFHLPPHYATEMGQLMLSAELDVLKQQVLEEPEYEFESVCKLKQDMRCQPGHVIRHWESTGNEKVHAFRRNVQTTVLVADRSALTFLKQQGTNKVLINSIRSRDILDLSGFDVPDGMPLCKSFFYSEEHVPNTNVFGSGVFINPVTVVTASHVLEQVHMAQVKPDDVLFIRGYISYDSDDTTMEVYPDQLYVLDQTRVIESDHMKYGSEDGDMAWVQVKPFELQQGIPAKGFAFEKWNGSIPAPVTIHTPVYALGHGLGVPMKLSFGGTVSQATYNHKTTMFTCKLNILPGSSGCPIFHAESHQLVGIVSGLHEVNALISAKENCISLEISMKGNLNGIATHIDPFRF